MNGLEFRHRGREMVDYLVDYLDNIDARRVTPNIEPGYLKDLIPTYPPEYPEDWDTIMDDVEKKIMIGVSNGKSSNKWVTPRFDGSSHSINLSRKLCHNYLYILQTF